MSVQVEPDHGCVQGLRWRLVFEAGIDTDTLCTALGAMGLTDRATMPVVREFHHDKSRTRVVVVPRTGRVQLRVDIGVAPEERPTVAVAFAQWIASQLAPARDAA